MWEDIHWWAGEAVRFTAAVTMPLVVCAVFIAVLVCIYFGGYHDGRKEGRRVAQNTAIEAGHGYWHPTTREFTWGQIPEDTP